MMDHIRGLIEARGLKYSYIAERLGVSRKTFSHIMTGRRRITVAEVVKLSELLNVSLEEIVKGGVE